MVLQIEVMRVYHYVSIFHSTNKVHETTHVHSARHISVYGVHNIGFSSFAILCLFCAECFADVMPVDEIYLLDTKQ